MSARTAVKEALVGLVVAAGLVVATSEIFLRLVPSRLVGGGSSVTTELHPTVGYTYTPGATFRSKSACFDVAPLATSSLGLRGDEWGEPAPGEIALLGDSVVAALESPEGESTAPLLAALLGRPVRSVAVSGWGTVAQLRAYETFLAPRRPELVIVFFLPYNDPADNDAGMADFESQRLFQPSGFVARDGVRLTPAYDPPHFFGSRGRRRLDGVLRHSMTFRLVYSLARATWPSAVVAFERGVVANEALAPRPPELQEYVVRARAAMEERYAKDRQEYKLDVMRPPVSWVWEDAWAVTEHALAALAQAVARDGGRLALVSVPLAQQLVAGEWRDLQTYPYAAAWPEDADPSYPARRLREIAARIGAVEIDLVPPLRSWVATHLEPDPQLRRIGLHFRCDGHPSPLGHLLLASTLARELTERGLASPRDGDAAGVRRIADESLAASPRTLLGETAFAQLYGGGVLDGRTAVSERREAWERAR